MVTWLQCMEIAHTISASILASQDHELTNLTTLATFQNRENNRK